MKLKITPRPLNQYSKAAIAVGVVKLAGYVIMTVAFGWEALLLALGIEFAGGLTQKYLNLAKREDEVRRELGL